MGNQVATRSSGGALAAVKALKANLTKVRDTLPQGGLGYMRFLQDGNWVFGQENNEIAKGKDELALNPLSIKTGWSCWTDYDEKGKKNELLEEVLVPLGKEPPLKHELKDHGWEWRELITADFKILSGPHKGKQVTYNTTSAGGISMMRALIEQVLVQLDEDEVNIVPVITLGSDHYNHKLWGRTYTPEFDLVEFISMDGEDMSDDGEDEQPEEEKPARSRREDKPSRSRREPEPEPEQDERPAQRARRAAEPEPEEQPEEQAEDETPRRRRRR